MAARSRPTWTSIERSNGLERLAPDRVDQLLAGQHAAGPLGQHQQQVELIGR